MNDYISDEGIFQTEDILYICKHQLSEALAEHIINAWESRLLWREIIRSCRSAGADDKQILLAKSQEFIQKCHHSESLNLLMNYGRKNRIAHRIFDYIDREPRMVVEGFITFCMQDYLTEIKFAVEVAYEELKNEKEYNEFVNLLRYFVETQVPKVQEVNLLMGTGGIFYLWDGNGTQIDDNYMSYYLEDMLLEEINLDDVLISILITISPRRIIIHDSDSLADKESIATIHNVFQDRIIYCAGCERCWKLKSGETRQHQPR